MQLVHVFFQGLFVEEHPAQGHSILDDPCILAGDKDLDLFSNGPDNLDIKGNANPRPGPVCNPRYTTVNGFASILSQEEYTLYSWLPC